MKFALRRGMAGEVSPHGHTVSGAHLSFGFHSRKDTRASSYFISMENMRWIAAPGAGGQRTCVRVTS